MREFIERTFVFFNRDKVTRPILHIFFLMKISIQQNSTNLLFNTIMMQQNYNINSIKYK